MKIVTEEQIQAAKTENGGWTKAQLLEWGVPWPPEKGWQQKLIDGVSIAPIASKSKTKMRREAGRVAMRNKALMCRIWINLGFPNPHCLKNDVLASMIISHFKLDITQNRVSNVVEWATFTSPSLLADTRPQTKAKAKRRSVLKKEKVDCGKNAPSLDMKTEFYKSWDWRTLRMQALKRHGARCQCCGATKDSVDISGDPVRIVVDHIQPLARRWDLRLETTNLQILCDECNQGKGAWDRTDWRAA